MRKTMYVAMNNFAQYIATHEGDFSTIWNSWSNVYSPPDDMTHMLRKMGKQLCRTEKNDIASIPEPKYRAMIKAILKNGKHSAA